LSAFLDVAMTRYMSLILDSVSLPFFAVMWKLLRLPMVFVFFFQVFESLPYVVHGFFVGFLVSGDYGSVFCKNEGVFDVRVRFLDFGHSAV